jgi:pimeloyl-ACP methyl ester carboxylesterase
MAASGYSIANVRDMRTPDDRLLRLYEAGDPDGQLVIVHHGTPGSGLLGNRWAEDALARGIRLVGYSRPGYDGSDRHPGRSVAAAAGDCAAIADFYGAARFRTWGASGGGPHALACAALLPDRVVAAATIASVAPFDADDLDWYAGMGQENIDEFSAAVAGEQEVFAFTSAMRPHILDAGPEGLTGAMSTLLPPVDVAVLTGELGAVMYETMARGIRGAVDGWVDDDLAFSRPWGFDPASISVPMLLLQGAQDRMVPFAHGKWLAANIPQAAAQLSDEDGHLTLLDRVEAVHGWLLAQG